MLDAFVDHLLLERRLSPHTARAYRADLASLGVFLARGDVGFGQATHSLLRRWLAHLGTRGYARSSVARKAASVRSFYAWAARRGLVEGDPAVLLGSPSPHSRLPRVLSVSEAEALASAPSRADRLRNKGGWVFSPCAGARRRRTAPRSARC